MTDPAVHPYIANLTGAVESEWLACARMLVSQKKMADALAVLRAGIQAYPSSTELRLALAGSLLEQDLPREAESILHALLAEHPGHAAAAFLLARLLHGEGRMRAVAETLRALFAQPGQDIEHRIQAIELLDDCGRPQDALALCEESIAAGCNDSRLHVHAGRLASQLGQFELARRRHSFVLEHSEQALAWHVPLALAELQRYADRTHPDFARFSALLQRTDANTPERAGVLFALAKAYDDTGDYAEAAGYLRDANAIRHASVRWSRKLWRRSVEARLQRAPPAYQHAASTAWTPIFIVGAPRSGTTLIAERLARHPLVCLRGEQNWFPQLASALDDEARPSRALIDQAANIYARQLHQDDSDAQWFIDKQPFNFMHVDRILALFPNARIIYCVRHARDNALSLWMQSFPAGVQDFAYDLNDIAAVIHDAQRLCVHWMQRYAASIHVLRYEDMVADAGACLASISAWLNLPPHDLLATSASTSTLRTASLWQARQPVHNRSVGRWKHYAPFLPELGRIRDLAPFSSPLP